MISFSLFLESSKIIGPDLGEIRKQVFSNDGDERGTRHRNKQWWNCDQDAGLVFAWSESRNNFLTFLFYPRYPELRVIARQETDSLSRSRNHWHLQCRSIRRRLVGEANQPKSGREQREITEEALDLISEDLNEDLQAFISQIPVMKLPLPDGLVF